MDKIHVPERGLTRRSLLRASLIGAVAVAVGRLIRPSAAFADELPEGRLTFVNLRTDERLDVTYRDETGA
jgi:hypothetical protein